MPYKFYDGPIVCIGSNAESYLHGTSDVIQIGLNIDPW